MGEESSLDDTAVDMNLRHDKDPFLDDGAGEFAALLPGCVVELASPCDRPHPVVGVVVVVPFVAYPVAVVIDDEKEVAACVEGGRQTVEDHEVAAEVRHHQTSSYCMHLIVVDHVAKKFRMSLDEA